MYRLCYYKLFTLYLWSLINLINFKIYTRLYPKTKLPLELRYIVQEIHRCVEVQQRVQTSSRLRYTLPLMLSFTSGANMLRKAACVGVGETSSPKTCPSDYEPLAIEHFPFGGMLPRKISKRTLYSLHRAGVSCFVQVFTNPQPQRDDGETSKLINHLIRESLPILYALPLTTIYMLPAMQQTRLVPNLPQGR